MAAPTTTPSLPSFPAAFPSVAMSPPDATTAVNEHLLQDSESSDRKPQLAAGGDEIRRDGQPEAIKPRKLQRYWLRTIVLILIPSVVTAWYGVIWVALVLGVENDEVVQYRTFSGSQVYYSWFIIGVFGLSWSKFGLAGAEVAMLQTPFWRAPNLVAFLMHFNTTWSGPSGWLSAIYHSEFHRLWCLLTFLSILPFIAFPLSGLVFDISDGYIQTKDHPHVVGRNETTFNEVWSLSFGTFAETAWQVGTTPIVPGFGLIYTPSEGVDRTEHPSSLGRVPNTLPLADPIPEMFLPPQPDVPVSGKAWGLRVKYDCSIVRDASEFTILSQKHESTLKTWENNTDISPFVTLRIPSGDSIDIFNSDLTPESLHNIWAYSEMGSNHQKLPERYYRSHPDFAPDDVSKSTVLEYALWQFQFQDYYDNVENKVTPFNTTVGPGIEGLGSPFLLSENKLTVNDTFFKVRAGDNYTEVSDGPTDTHSEPVTNLRDIFNTELLTDYTDEFAAMDAAAPIGVRCVVSSGLGTAALDGVTTTFSDYERVDPNNEKMEEIVAGPSIFGYTAFQSLTKRFKELYQAGHLPPEVPQGSEKIYTSYIHDQALRQAVMLAYGLDALQLMYDINPAPEGAWVNTDLRSAREGKILGIAPLIPGTAVGHFVLALLCLWSGLSAALGVAYGFRKRPSDRLDGESVFRRGVDMSEDVKHNNEFQSGKPFYANKKFQALPGS